MRSTHKNALLLFVANRLGYLHLGPTAFLPIFEQWCFEQDALAEYN